MSSAVQVTDVPKEDLNTNPETKYEVMEILGEGVFGRVAKCRNRATKDIVALKLLKKGRQTYKREMQMLGCIKELDPDRFNLVKFIESFECEDRRYMAFEMLDMSVYDLMEVVFTFSLSQIRTMTKQLLIALQGLQTVSVIHCDIKPDNIMLVNYMEQPYKVKLIDFGMAKHYDQMFLGQMMQPFSFRAPEVILGLPLWEAVDVWSLGCCLFLWYQGGEDFLSYSNFDNLAKTVHVLGIPEPELLDEGLYTRKYFVLENNSWRLKTLQEFQETTDIDPEMSDQPSASSLEELIKRAKKLQSDEECRDRDAFLDLLSKMLEINAEKRITPAEALLHPFITMDHLPKEDNYTKEAKELVRVAETTYRPLQRESLEEIAEKQQKEAFATNNSTSRADEGIVIASSFDLPDGTDTDKRIESPGEIVICQLEDLTGHFSANAVAVSQLSGETGILVPSNNKLTSSPNQHISPGEIMLDSHCSGTELAHMEPTNKEDTHDDERKSQTQTQEENNNLSQAASEAEEADNFVVQQEEPDTALEIVAVLEAVKEEMPAECNSVLEDIGKLVQKGDATEAEISEVSQKASRFRRLIPRPLRVFFSRLLKLLRPRRNKPFFRKPKWVNLFQRRSTTSGPSGP